MIDFKIKDGVEMTDIDWDVMAPVLGTAAEIWKLLHQKLVITSACDGVHMEGSKHYIGHAFDFRTYYFDKKTQYLARDFLAASLGDDYDVVVESDHMHVEYDPKTDIAVPG